MSYSMSDIEKQIMGTCLDKGMNKELTICTMLELDTKKKQEIMLEWLTKNPQKDYNEIVVEALKLGESIY